MHITKTPCCSKICVNNSQDPLLLQIPPEIKKVIDGEISSVLLSQLRLVTQ
jgi:hypothetical protein